MKKIVFLILIFSSTILCSAVENKENKEIAQLAYIVKQCIDRHDTQSPVFHGCIDWHSAVHAHWALLWASYRLKDDNLKERILARLNTKQMAKEYHYFKKQSASFEMPYGRAWFLQLALDAEQLYQYQALRPFADKIFSSLLQYMRRNKGDVFAADYQNASWYLYHLLRWAEFTHNQSAFIEIKNQIKRRVLNQNWHNVTENKGFFNPKSLALLALTAAKIDNQQTQQLANALIEETRIPKKMPFIPAHHGGLNYSRAWGLWALSKTTLQPQYQIQARQHHQAMLNSIQQWSKDYYRYGHWVAQFGLFADRIKQTRF